MKALRALPRVGPGQVSKYVNVCVCVCVCVCYSVSWLDVVGGD